VSALLNLGLRTAVGTLLPTNDQAESTASPQRDKLPPTLHAFTPSSPHTQQSYDLKAFATESKRLQQATAWFGQTTFWTPHR